MCRRREVLDEQAGGSQDNGNKLQGRTKFVKWDVGEKEEKAETETETEAPRGGTGTRWACVPARVAPPFTRLPRRTFSLSDGGVF